MGTPAAGIEFLERTISQGDAELEELDCFSSAALSELRDLTAEEGRVTCRLPVTPRVSNRAGTLHGGCIATLVDTVGTAALVTVSPQAGTSVNLNVYCLGKAAGELVIDAQVVRLGRSLAMIHVNLRNAETLQLVAQGTHMKSLTERDLLTADLEGFQAHMPEEACV